jgi:phosphoribosyl-ATP pyrophosphohydrolase
MKPIERIANHNGIAKIKDKIQEELIELHVAIDNNIEEEIIDEIADVMVTMAQWMLKTSNRAKVNERIAYKIDRTIKLFEMEEVE